MGEYAWSFCSVFAIRRAVIREGFAPTSNSSGTGKSGQWRLRIIGVLRSVVVSPMCINGKINDQRCQHGIAILANCLVNREFLILFGKLDRFIHFSDLERTKILYTVGRVSMVRKDYRLST